MSNNGVCRTAPVTPGLRRRLKGEEWEEKWILGGYEDDMRGRYKGDKEDIRRG